MSREITTHKGGLLNDELTITTGDELGPGGAGIHYNIWYKSIRRGVRVDNLCYIKFHTGDPRVSIEGVSNEALIAILIDRYEGFQRGPFACEENARTLEHLRNAMSQQIRRTTLRAAEGKEGTQRP